jgi:hypothetical protein
MAPLKKVTKTALMTKKSVACPKISLIPERLKKGMISFKIFLFINKF